MQDLNEWALAFGSLESTRKSLRNSAALSLNNLILFDSSNREEFPELLELPKMSTTPMKIMSNNSYAPYGPTPPMYLSKNPFNN